MKYIYRIFVLILTSVALQLSAATSLPIVQILGQQYYVYEVKKGDSLFGIARENGWDDATLKKLNTNISSPLTKGTKLYYPVADGDKVAAPAVSSPEEAGLLAPLTHKVKSGETVYSISRTYGVPVETIYKLNENSRKGIKAGEKLVLRKSELKQNSTTSGYYTIKKGDTLYKVAKDNGVTVAAILKENPGVSDKNFKAGSIIKLPPAGSGITMTVDTVQQSTLTGFSSYKVAKDETWAGIAKKNNVDVAQLKNANPGVSKLKANQVISIPNIETTEVEREVVAEDPRELSNDGVQDIYEDVHRIADNVTSSVKLVALLADPTSKKDLEFTRGILTALENLKNSGIKVDFKVMDGTKSSSDILTELSDFKPTIILYTADNGVPSYLTEYSTIACVPFVNSFDIKSEAYTDNPYLIQLLTPSSYFNGQIAQYIVAKYNGYKLLFVGEGDDTDQIASSLRSLWKSSDIKTVADTDLTKFTFGEGNNYLIYGNPVKKADVSQLLTSTASAMIANPMVDIKVIGRPNWIVFDDQLSEQLHQVDALIPSRFYFDKDSREGKRFIADFKELFERTPIKSFPVYAAMGYDAAEFFINGLAKSNGDINGLRYSDSTLQIPFRLRRPSNWTGFVNPAVYIVRFTPFDTIEKIVVE